MDTELDLDLKETSMYIKAHSLAVKHIEKKLGSFPDFFWIRCNHMMHSFDDMVFGYKNQVFSILLRFYHDGEEISEYKNREIRFLKAAIENDLIPCIFRIDITGNKDHPKNHHKIIGLNLSDITGQPINPLEIASDKPVVMSKYELHNLAIRYIEKELEKNGYEVVMYYDDPNVPEFFPQIWFFDKKGNFSWIIVKYYTKKEDVKTPDTRKAKRLHVQMNGYFAPVVFTYENKKPYRGINNRGAIRAEILEDIIKQIHTAIDV